MLSNAWKVPCHIRFSVVFTLASIFGGVDSVNGQSSQDVTRIEEDWSVTVVEPDSAITAPQFTSVMTPDSADPSTYFTAEFNHSTSPAFQAGGIQLQTWVDDRQEQASPRLRERSLSTNNEKIQWTQYMEISGRNLEFGLSRMKSNSWRRNYWYDWDWMDSTITMASTALSNLNNYRISDSVNSSAVGFSANRVASMILVEVRVYVGEQLVQTIEVNQDLRQGN